MKTTILIIFTVTVALLSQTASADRRHYRGYDRHYDYGLRGRNHYFSYNRGYRGNRYGFSYGSRHYDRHFNTGSFIGGLVLGSVLTAPRYSTRRVEKTYVRRTPVRRTSQVTVVNSSSSGSERLAPERRLLRDLEGRCYEVVRNENGDEIRNELEPQSCSF